MLKRILVALDRDRDNGVATRYAQALGERFAAESTMLAIGNPRVVNFESGPVTDVSIMHYAEQPRARRVQDEPAGAHALLDVYDEGMDETRVRNLEYATDRVPYRRIADEMKYHDILVIGRHSKRPEAIAARRSLTLARIVKHGISPSLVVPEEYREVERVLVAYDASDPAARTMQKFAQLQPFGTQLNVEIVHVRGWVGDHFTRRSELRLSQAAAYFAAHRFDEVETTSLEMAEPQERILEYARECKADLIVAGAHSVSAMQRIAFGSTTHALLAGCPVPFFLFH